MRNTLRIAFPLFAVLVSIPIGAIYRLNIENWAEHKGFDTILTGGLQAVMDSSLGVWLIILFFVLIGGSIALWLDFFVRKYTTISIPKTRKVRTTVSGRTFRNEKVLLDGYRYEGCTFINCTLIYNGGAGELRNNKFDAPIIESDVPEIEKMIFLLNELGYVNVPILRE